MDGLPEGRVINITVLVGDVHEAWPPLLTIPPWKWDKTRSCVASCRVKDNLSVCWKLLKYYNQEVTTAECWNQCLGFLSWHFDPPSPHFQRGARQKKLENHCSNVLWLKVSTKCHMAEWGEEEEKNRQGSHWDTGSHYIQNVTLWHKHYI